MPAEPATEALAAAVLLGGAASDPSGILRDLASLMARYRSHDTTAANRVMTATKNAVAASQPALNLLAQVDRLSQASSDLPFGPVRHTDPAAVDRLALLTQIGSLSFGLFPFFRKGVRDFAGSSQGTIPDIIKVAASVQERLGGLTLNALRWRDEALPLLLESSFDFAEPVVAATGGQFLDAWSQTVAWITPWISQRPTLNPKSPLVLDDGFFDGAHPVALHPLVLRVLKPRLQGMLAVSASRDEALAFCSFLAHRGIAADEVASATLFAPAGSPGTLLSAGALLIGLARESGVTLSPDGTLTGGTPVFAGYVDRTLKALIFGCERDAQPLPASWQDKALLHDLLRRCPDWAESRLGGPLRKKAEALAVPAFTNLNQSFKQAPALVPSEVLSLNVDGFAMSPARPNAADLAKSNPIQIMANKDAVVQDFSNRATVNRKIFAERFSGPIGEPILVKLLPNVASDRSLEIRSGPVGTYLASRIASLSATTLFEEFLAGNAWASLVNASAPAIAGLLPLWAALECWDGLRARLVQQPLTAEDAKLAINLAKALPDWLIGSATPPSQIDAGRLRPVLAAVGLLGLPTRPLEGLPQTLPNLLQRLRHLLEPASTLNADVKAALGAAEIELTISFIAASSKGLTVSEVFGTRSDIDHFVSLARTAVQQPTAWDARARLNAFVLLARIAEMTSDPLIAKVADQLPSDIVELVASSVDRFLRPSPSGPAISGLPLALAASSLVRFTRERSRALSAVPATPSWLNAAPPLPADLQGDPDAAITKMIAAFGDPATGIFAGFAWQGGRSGRALLLALYQIRLREFGAKRRLTVNPLSGDNPDLAELRRLDSVSRQIFCIEKLLLEGLPERAVTGKFMPWWSVRFWSHPGPTAMLGTGGGDPRARALAIINWMSAWPVDVNANQLALAASLAGETPVVREGEPVDIDQRSAFSLPNLSFRAAKEGLEGAIRRVKEAEQQYTQAINRQEDLDNQAEIIALLKQPLLLSTADAREQLDAARAEVRQAEADLEAAEHELTASQFEAASVRLIYQASLTEIERQKILKTIADLDSERKAFETEEAAILVDEAAQDVTSAGLMTKKAELLQKAAKVRLDLATQSRASIIEQIKLLELLLRTPVPVDVPGMTVVNGLVRRMGEKIAFSLKTKLEDDLAEAERDLQAAIEEAIEEEEQRRALERQRSFIKGILSVVGTVVGFVAGGPAGAALGAAISGAVGNFVGGIVTKQPIETLIVGLGQDAFTAAKAGGVNLNGVLANVGSAAGADAKQLFAILDTNIKPVLANIPTVLDEAVLRDAFEDLTFVNVPPGIDDRPDRFIANVVDQIRSGGTVPGDLTSILADAGVQNPVAFTDSESFIELVSDLLANRLAAVNPSSPLVPALRGLVGLEAGTPAEVAKRLSTLVATRIGMSMNQYRAEKLKNWIALQQKRGKNWSDVATSGNKLIARLFPEPEMRSKVLANVQLTLVNPQLFQAVVKTKLIPWQQELDRRIAEVHAAGDRALQGMSQPTSVLGAAQARVAFITASQERFFAPNGLLAFLRGDSDQRRQLIVELDQLRRDDAAARGELHIEELNLEGAGLDADIARSVLKKARLNVQRADTLLNKCKLTEEIASWQQQLTALGVQHAEISSQAQEKAEESAEEKVKACEARVKAARAALDARRAYRAAANERASEAIRIRHAVNRPPLQLQTNLNGTMAVASLQHLQATDSGFSAAREILRLLRIVPREGGQTTLPVPTLSGPNAVRWSDYLNAQMEALEEAFKNSSPRNTPTAPLVLGREQIDALLPPAGQPAGTRPRGLRLVFRPGVVEMIDGDLVQRNIDRDDARNGRVVGILLSGRAENGVTLADHYRLHAEYRGDHWITKGEVHFIDVLDVSAARMSFMPPEIGPIPFILQHGALHDFEGDQRFNRVKGTPISGTTLIHLEPVNPVPIKELSLFVIFNTIVPKSE